MRRYKMIFSNASCKIKNSDINLRKGLSAIAKRQTAFSSLDSDQAFITNENIVAPKEIGATKCKAINLLAL